MRQTPVVIAEIAAMLTGGWLAGRISRKRSTRRVRVAASGGRVVIPVWFSRQDVTLRLSDLPVATTSKAGLSIENPALDRAGAHPPLLGNFGDFWNGTLSAAADGSLPIHAFGDRVQLLRPAPNSPSTTQVVLELSAADWSLVRASRVNASSRVDDDRVQQ